MTTLEYQMRLTNFLERARRFFPKKEVVSIEADGELVRKTYLEEYRRICQLANALKRLGLKKGDAVGSFAWNTHRHYELYFAVPCMGCMLHTINIRLSNDDMKYTIDAAKDKWIFIEEDLIGKFEPVAKTLKDVKGYIVLTKKTDIKALATTSLSPLYLYENLIAAEKEEFEFPEDYDENTPASLFFTGGTTGRPKGIIVTHRHMYIRALAETSAEQYGVNQRDAILHVVPLFHINAWYFPQAATLVGAKQVFSGVRSLTPEQILHIIETEKVTLTGGVPTVWMDCLNVIKTGKRKYDLSSLRYIITGGAAMPRSAMEDYDALGVTCVHAFGSSESPFTSTAFIRPEVESLPKEEIWKKRASVGYAFAGLEFKVVREDGTEVEWNGVDRGEAICRGPWTITSYYNNPEASAETFRDGWYHFGDIVTVDEYGYINIVDRLKDVIKTGGEWVSSIDLENACMAHPKVREACAVGVKHEKWSERPILFVVPVDEHKGNLTENDILEFLKERVPKWWLPDKTIFLDAIPRTGPGKFDKKVLRAEYMDVLTKPA